MQKITMKEQEILALVRKVPVWFQPIRLGSVVAPAICDSRYMEWKASAIPDDLTGKSVIDFGASDGYYSFLAEERGASKVVAVDSYEGYTHPDPNQAFRAAKTILNSNVEYRILNFFELSKSNETFDISFFFDVLYHLPDPISVLSLLARMTREVAVVSTVHFDSRKPVMYLYEPYELAANDPSNYWGVSSSCLSRLLTRAGFKRMEEIRRLHNRILVRAFK